MYACIHLRLRFCMFLFLYGLIVCVIFLYILDNKQYIVVAARVLCVIERNHIEHLFLKCYFVSSNSLVGVFFCYCCWLDCLFVLSWLLHHTTIPILQGTHKLLLLLYCCYMQWVVVLLLTISIESCIYYAATLRSN